jgi:hypothetical protein
MQRPAEGTPSSNKRKVSTSLTYLAHMLTMCQRGPEPPPFPDDDTPPPSPSAGKWFTDRYAVHMLSIYQVVFRAELRSARHHQVSFEHMLSICITNATQGGVAPEAPGAS